MKNPFRNFLKRRQDPIALWVNGESILVPGYTPLSRNEEVRRCVYKIADLVSSMTIMLMKNADGGDERLKNELAKKIDIYPNRNMVRKTFIHKVVTDLCLYGNCVVLPEVADAYIDNLEILSIESVYFARDGDSYKVKYKGKAYRPDEVLHFVLNPDDMDSYKGQGYKSLVTETVKNLMQQNATKTSFLQSKWKPSLIISVSSDAEELQNAELRKRVLGSYAGTTEAGEPWLIPAGEIDVKTIQPLTLNDLAIQDGITLDMKAIAAAFGIPAFMVGVGDFDKDEYNNFVGTTVMSVAMAIQQELSKKLLYSPELYFKFNPKSLMQYSLDEQMSFVKDMVSGGMMSRNEGRAEFDYAPVANAGMNEYIVLENYIPVGRIGDQKKLNGGDEE